MMRSKLVMVAICGLWLSGCGTFGDAISGPVNDHVFYRGVRLDVEAVKEGGSGVLMAGDIPFSAIADTLLVPYLAYHELTDPPRKGSQAPTEERARADERKTDPSIRAR